MPVFIRAPRLGPSTCSRLFLLLVAFIIGWITAKYLLEDFRVHDLEISSHLHLRQNTRIQEDTMANNYQGRAMEDIQEERRQRIREHCRVAKNAVISIEGRQFGHFVVDTEHKILVCLNYKAATRQLKRIIGSLTGVKMPEGALPRDIFKWGSDFSPKEKLVMSRTYFSFFFAREPLVRLLSAFLDKFYRVASAQYRLSYGRRIIAKYRQNPSQQSLETGNDVKFSEFAQFVLDGGMNEHWQLATIRCFPCAIEYDFIGKFENFLEELPHLFKAAGVPEVPLTRPYTSHNTSAEVHHYYSQLSRSQILELAEIYRPDYEAFGYPFPGPLFKDLVGDTK